MFWLIDTGGQPPHMPAVTSRATPPGNWPAGDGELLTPVMADDLFLGGGAGGQEPMLPFL